MKVFSGLLFLIICSHTGFGQLQSVSVEDRQIYYTVRGTGPPVLVFHGWLQTGDDWKQLLESMEASYQVIYVDLPGHGKSGTIGDDFSIQQTADLMHEFIEKLELRGARALGFSFGGMLLLEILASDPSVFREVILISTPYIFSGSDHEAVSYDSLPDEFKNHLVQQHSGGEFQVRALFNPALDYSIALSEGQLARIYIPVMIISGEEDPLCPVSQSRALASELSSSDLWIVKGKGHQAVDASNAPEFYRRATSFFSDF